MAVKQGIQIEMNLTKQKMKSRVGISANSQEP